MQRYSDMEVFSLFSQQFFELEDIETDLTVHFPFPLPQSSETLADFFASDEGKQFKSALKTVVDLFAEWADSQKIDSSPCKRFSTIYSNYDGHDVELNKEYFILYREGIPTLNSLTKLLKDRQLPIDFRQTVVKNLIQGINVCAPGTYSNIMDAYLELYSRKNMSLKWAVIRKKIASDVAVAVISKDISIEGLMHIHYRNQLLNFIATNYGFKKTPDKNIRYCRNAKTLVFLDEFRRRIAASLTPEAVINCILSELPWQQLPQIIQESPDRYLDHYDHFNDLLNSHGSDSFHENDKPVKTFYMDDLLILDDDGGYQLRWKAHSALFYTLFHRLILAGNINLSEMKNITLIPKIASFHYLPSQTLRMAYVHEISEDTQRPYQSFMPYCIEALCFDREKKARLVAFITSHYLSSEQKLEFVKEILHYLHSYDFSLHEENEKLRLHHRLINVMIRLFPEGDHLIFIVNHLSQAYRNVYANRIIRPLLQNKQKAVDFIRKAPAGDHREILVLLGKENVNRLVDSFDHLVDLTNHLSINALRLFFSWLEVKNIEPFIPNTYLFDIYIAKITSERLIIFMNAFSKTLLSNIFTEFKSLLQFIRLLKIKSTYLYEVFALAIPAHILQDLVKTPKQLLELLNHYPSEHLLLALNKFSNEQLRELFLSDTPLDKCLDSHKELMENNVNIYYIFLIALTRSYQSLLVLNPSLITKISEKLTRHRGNKLRVAKELETALTRRNFNFFTTLTRTQTNLLNKGKLNCLNSAFLKMRPRT